MASPAAPFAVSLTVLENSAAFAIDLSQKETSSESHLGNRRGSEHIHSVPPKPSSAQRGLPTLFQETRSVVLFELVRNLNSVIRTLISKTWSSALDAMYHGSTFVCSIYDVKMMRVTDNTAQL